MKRQISIDQLKPGMYVTEIKNVSWLKTPFLRNKHLLKNGDEVQAVKDCGADEVYIDTELGDDLAPDQRKPDDAEHTRGTDSPAAEATPPEPPGPDTLDPEQSSSPDYIDWHWDADSVRSEEVVPFFDTEQALSHMDGDEELLRETVQIFLEEYPQILARLHTALKDEDAKTLEREAHSIKGAVANLGATAAYEAAFQLEQIGQAGNLGRAEGAITELELELKRLEKLLFGFQSRKAKALAPQSAHPAAPQVSPFSPAVIVVDKLRSTRETLCGLLRRQGIINIRQVEDGTEALEALKRSQADLIIADWSLSGMTGVELLRTIRGDEKLRDIPFLMVTGTATRDEVLEAAQAGVSGYLLKPFTADILADQLRRVFPDQHPVPAAA